jgi:hypothetical protein
VAFLPSTPIESIEAMVAIAGLLREDPTHLSTFDFVVCPLNVLCCLLLYL